MESTTVLSFKLLVTRVSADCDRKFKVMETWSSFAHLLPSYLGQETAMWPLQSSSQAATCYFQPNRLKIEASR